MLREVIGAIMAGFVGVILLSVILPVLKNVQNMVFDNIDTTDPTTLQLMALGDTVYVVLGFVVFFVTGFIILSYAARRDPYDIS
jgi:ABC-type antimicrobial peptide transport system permease subunit